MPILIVLEVLIQFACAYHCIQRKNERRWLFLILLFPVMGPALYFFTEILPEMQRRGPAGASVMDNLQRNLNPRGEIQRLQEEVTLSNTVKNKENLADEYARKGEYTQAIETYTQCLEGRYQNDAGILLKLARVYFVSSQYQEAIEQLHKIQALSDYRPSRVKLLLAQCYEGLENTSKARQYYEAAVKEKAGMESKCLYADFLLKQGESTEANALLEKVLLSAKRMPKHSQKLNAEWIKFAKKHYKG